MDCRQIRIEAFFVLAVGESVESARRVEGRGVAFHVVRFAGVDEGVMRFKVALDGALVSDPYLAEMIQTTTDLKDVPWMPTTAGFADGVLALPMGDERRFFRVKVPEDAK